MAQQHQSGHHVFSKLTLATNKILQAERMTHHLALLKQGAAEEQHERLHQTNSGSASAVGQHHHATTEQQHHHHQQPAQTSMFSGLMGVSSAMKKFRSLKSSGVAGDGEDDDSPIKRQHHFSVKSDSEKMDSASKLKTISSESDSSEDYFDEERTSPSLYASTGNLRHGGSMKSLLAADDIMRSSKKYAMVLAARHGDWAAVERELKLMKKGDPRLNQADPRTGETTLMIASQKSQFLLVGRLCDMGCLMNLRSEDRRTALHYAAVEGHEEIVKLLLRNKADPNLFGGENLQLPLHIAAARAVGGLVSAQYLLRASLRETRLLKDGLGNLPITYAIESGSLVLVREMLQYFQKQQVSWQHDRTGDYLVHIAARRQNTAIMHSLGIDGGATMNVQNHDGQTPLHICAKLGDEAMIKLLEPFKADADLIDKKERTALHVAAEHGHTAIVELLVERFKANVHMRTKDGSTLMHLAADRGYPETVLAFIKRGVPMNMPNKSGALCLHAAAQNGHLQVVTTLIRKGSSVDARTKDGYTALHLAVLNTKPDIIQALLGFGAKVDLKGGPLKEAPLHIAARLPEGYQCADMLLKSGAIVNNVTEETGETPLHIAAKTGSLELLKLLLEEGADPMRLNRSGESALHYAVRNCWFDSAKAIVSFVNNNSSGREATNLVNLANVEGETCFHLAAELGKSQTHNPFEDVDIIRLLLENGADPLAVTNLTNETSLHYCARSGNPDIFQEIVRHLKGTFQLACNRQDRMGWSPLMTSCEAGHAAAAEILLSNGARADVFDEHGKAALHLASENGHEACCEMLLKHKAFVNAKSKLGISPLHFAAQSGFADLVKLLIKKYNAALNALSLDKKTPLHLAAGAGRKDVCLLLMNLKADANAIDALGQNPLHLAAENDHSDVVKLFIKYKPELVTAASKSGMTCAHIAAKNGSEAVIKLLMQFNKTLVTNVRNQVNEALPLHLAVSGSHENVVKILIDAGSSPIAENHEGMTAIHMAAKEGDMEVLQAIIASSPRGALKTNSLKNGLSPLHFASFYGKSEIIRELQTRVDINSKTDLAQMANVVSDPELKALISIDHGLTPLHMASYRGHENVVRLILNNSGVQTEVVTTLLGRVPLHYAAMNGHSVVVSLLMSRSASHLKFQDKKGRVPLHLASENGHAEMVSMLLGQGAEINLADQDGWSALHFATKNGHLKVVKLLCEAGAISNLKTADGKVPLNISASGLHIELFYYLLKKEHDTEELMDDKTFLVDLLLCGKTNGNEAVNEFVMHSKAPLDTAAKLAKLYRELADREKERAKDLKDLARYCENQATELLGIAAAIAQPSAILRATDSKGKQFLDQLLENDMKQVIEHAAVQRYLSDIWAGHLSTWSSGRMFLLFMGFMFFPPLLVYFCLPFKHHSYHHIPVIKFMAMIVSHIYLIGLLSIVAAVPIHPIVYRDDFIPFWYELVCLAWVSGMLVAELSRTNASTGLGMLRLAIIFCCLIATLLHLTAIVIDLAFNDLQTCLIIMYIRNFMISLAILSAIILFIDFLLIHHLFGPFGIIISSVMRDLMIFVVVLLLFLTAFSFMTCCLFSPIKKSSSNALDARTSSNSSITTIMSPNLNISSNETGNATEPKISSDDRENKRQKREAGNINGAKCRPKIAAGNDAVKNRKKRNAPEYDLAGRVKASGDPPIVYTNQNYWTLVELFVWLYFIMYQMVDLDVLPQVLNGPFWSDYVFRFYIAAWLTVSSMILLPLLIAILTDTYKSIHMRSDAEWKFGRAKLIRDMIKMPAAPTPLNIPVRIYLYLRSVSKHGKLMCTKYAQYYLHEDEHEGAEQLLRGQTGPGQASTAVGLDFLETVLDWKVVVRRYRAVITGNTAELLAIAEEESRGQSGAATGDTNAGADGAAPGTDTEATNN